MKFYKKIIITNLTQIKYFAIILILFVFNFGLINTGFTQDFGPGNEQMKAFEETSGFAPASPTSLGSIVATVIQAFLGLLGIIFLVLIVTAGYRWMMAGGNEEKMKEAKDMIHRAIIGLIITVSAYAITYFVFTNISFGGGDGPGGQPL